MLNLPDTPTTAIVIGGGPAGLIAAEILAQNHVTVSLYEAMPSVGRKLLVAGASGLNLTHSEPFPQFLARYGKQQTTLQPILTAFGPQHLRDWAETLGVPTFVGSSGRVFPVSMTAAALLYRWRARLQQLGVKIFTHHRWLGWNTDQSLRFQTPDGEKTTVAPLVIFALGGGSWQQLGSNAAWVAPFQARGIPIAPLRPANCGFNVAWSEPFRQKFAGQPLKTISATCGQTPPQRGELVITQHGIEGSLVYAFSAALRDQLEQHGQATLTLDLLPDWSHDRLVQKLSQPRGTRSLASFLGRISDLKGVKLGLLWEFCPSQVRGTPQELAGACKSLPIPLVSPRPLDEAISTAGGVSFSALDDRLMLRDIPGTFCVGEMLDWEAPTGGYLLTACFATGVWAAHGALQWLHSLK
ncbi:MAG: TIGR03862 family flavoprotein [Anaerolineales bacterium]